MTKFCITCPFCHGSGGTLRSATIGLDAAGTLKNMVENAKHRCSACEGRGTIWAQQCDPPEGGTEPHAAIVFGCK